MNGFRQQRARPCDPLPADCPAGEESEKSAAALGRQGNAVERTPIGRSAGLSQFEQSELSAVGRGEPGGARTR